VLPGSTVLGTEGDLRVKAISLGRVHGGACRPGNASPATTVLMSGGFTPSVHLFSHPAASSVNEDLKAFLPGSSAECERSAGACRGVYDLADVLADGAASGAASAPEPSARSALQVEAPKRSSQAYLGVLPQAQAPSSAKSFVDWQHDVTSRDLDWPRAKVFNPLNTSNAIPHGMATDQGKTSNLNALAIVAKSLEVAIPRVG